MQTEGLETAVLKHATSAKRAYGCNPATLPLPTEVWRDDSNLRIAVWMVLYVIRGQAGYIPASISFLAPLARHTSTPPLHATAPTSPTSYAREFRRPRLTLSHSSEDFVPTRCPLRTPPSRGLTASRKTRPEHRETSEATRGGWVMALRRTKRGWRNPTRKHGDAPGAGWELTGAPRWGSTVTIAK